MRTAWKAIPTLFRTCAHCCSGLSAAHGSDHCRQIWLRRLGTDGSRKLTAGGKWIRTFGSPTDPLPFRDSQARLPSRFDLPTRNRWFDTTSLHQRLNNEPVDSVIAGSARGYFSGIRDAGRADDQMQVPVASGPGPGSVLPASQPILRAPSEIVWCYSVVFFDGAVQPYLDQMQHASTIRRPLQEVGGMIPK